MPEQPVSKVRGPLSAADIARQKLRAVNNVPHARPLRLPIQVMTKADVSRLCREMMDFQSFFTSAAVKGATAKTVPQTSQLLTALLNENKLNLLHEQDRNALDAFLNDLRANAPVVHAGFAADPKPDFLMRIVGWFRSEAHPYVLIQIGLRPSIAAGCVFRTANKYFDFSFKKHFEDNKAKLRDAIKVVS